MYCIPACHVYDSDMTTITIRLPEPLAADIAGEARRRQISKSLVVRERLQAGRRVPLSDATDAIADLIGPLPGLPTDLSTATKTQLGKWGYGIKHTR